MTRHVAWRCGAPCGASSSTSSVVRSNAERTGQSRLKTAQTELQFPPAGLSSGQLSLGGGQTALSLAQLQAVLSSAVLSCLSSQGQVLSFILELLLAAADLLQLRRQLSLTGAPVRLRVQETFLT